MATKTKTKTKDAEAAPAPEPKAEKPAKSKAEKPAKEKPAKEKPAKAEKPAEESSKRGGAHPKHPACPQCGKAMYKTMEKGKAVKKTDPWAYCRNDDCPQKGVDQSGLVKEAATEGTEDGAEEVVTPEEAPAPTPKAKPKTEKPKKETKAKSESVEIPDPHADKSEVFKKQYGRIVKKLAAAVEGDEAAKNIIGLCLSVVKTEEGVEAANAIVDELELENIGITRLSDEEE